MSTFKTIEAEDVFISPYNSKKRWECSGSVSLSSFGIEKYRGVENSEKFPSDIAINGYSDELVYKSISHLYYTGSLPDGTFTGSYDLALQTTKTISGSTGTGRSLSSEVAVLSIPKDVYGYNIDPFSIKIEPPKGEDSLYVYEEQSGSYMESEGVFYDGYIESPEFTSGGVTYSSSFFSSSAGTLEVSGDIIDDGEGNLIFSTASFADGTSGSFYVGNSIYNQGQLVITNPTVARYYSTYYDPSLLSWKSSFPIYTLNVNCRIREQEYNATYNPTAITGSNGDLKDNVKNPDFSPYITSIGLYDDDRNLLAVAKLSKPIQKSKDIEMIFKIQIDL